MAVTLVPPIRVRQVDVEADLAEMESLDVRAAEVLLRHKRYGKRRVESARFRVVKAEPYVEKRLFVDKDDSDVEYKIVLTHKTKGKVSTDWMPLEDDYVFANLSGLPLDTLEEIQQKIPEVRELIDDLRAALDP